MFNLLCCLPIRPRRHAEPLAPAAAAKLAAIAERQPLLTPKPVLVRHNSSTRARIDPVPSEPMQPSKPDLKRRPRSMSPESFDANIARQLEESFNEPPVPSAKALGKRPIRPKKRVGGAP